MIALQSEMIGQLGLFRVDWKNDNMGTETYIPTKTSETIFTRRYGISQFIHERMKLLAIENNSTRNNMPDVWLYNKHPLVIARPIISADQRNKIISIVDAEIIKQFNTMNCSNASDSKFLISLGNQRDWKYECCICLTNYKEEISNLKIGIIRPCGHTVCIDPCFKSVTKQNECPICRKKIDKMFRLGAINVSDLFDKSVIDSIVDKCLAVL